MNWLLIISIICFALIIVLFLALSVCIAGYSYCLLHDLGMKAGLIPKDKLEDNKE